MCLQQGYCVNVIYYSLASSQLLFHVADRKMMEGQTLTTGVASSLVFQCARQLGTMPASVPAEVGPRSIPEPNSHAAPRSEKGNALSKLLQRAEPGADWCAAVAHVTLASERIVGRRIRAASGRSAAISPATSGICEILCSAR
jgi:hypothetical protein